MKSWRGYVLFHGENIIVVYYNTAQLVLDSASATSTYAFNCRYNFVDDYTVNVEYRLRDGTSGELDVVVSSGSNNHLRTSSVSCAGASYYLQDGSVMKNDGSVSVASASPGSIIPGGEYISLEYLQSNGNQYIDTGYTVADPTFRYDIKYMKTGSLSSNPCGVERGSGTKEMHGNIYNNSAYLGNNCAINNIVSQALSTCYAVSFTYDASVTKAAWIVNGISYTYYGSGDWTGSTVSDFLFATNNGTTANYKMSGRIYYYRLYASNLSTLVRNFVPAKRVSDDILGMYDLVNNKFYTNAGSGNFTAGAVLDDEYVTLYTDGTHVYGLSRYGAKETIY